MSAPSSTQHLGMDLKNLDSGVGLVLAGGCIPGFGQEIDTAAGCSFRILEKSVV